MANILDQLPPGVEVPKRFVRSYRLLTLHVEGWHDGQRGQRQYQYGDDFHRTQGRKAVTPYTAGYEAGGRSEQPAEVEARSPT